MSHLSARLRHYQKCEGNTTDKTLTDAADRIDALEKALKDIVDNIDARTSKIQGIVSYYKDIVQIIRNVDPWRK